MKNCGDKDVGMNISYIENNSYSEVVLYNYEELGFWNKA